jgi:hypothetical protein
MDLTDHAQFFPPQRNRVRTKNLILSEPDCRAIRANDMMLLYFPKMNYEKEQPPDAPFHLTVLQTQGYCIPDFTSSSNS